MSNEIQFRNLNNTLNYTDTNYLRFYVTTLNGNTDNKVPFETYGDMQSLLNYSSECPDYCFCYMFDRTFIKSTPWLTATKIGKFSYYYMFNECKMLTKISHLPAKKLGESCYRAMFYKCDKLTNIPNLPATELEPFCYHSMFYDCTNLISAKNVKIKATVCPSSACNNMFTGCSGLQEPLELAFEQIDANGCYQMFYKCHNLKYAPQMNLRSVSSFGLQNAFYNCYSLSSGFGELNLTDEVIPEKAFYCCYYNCSSLIENIPTVLPNTQLSTSCFAYMFYGCSALSSVPELPATKLGDSCYSSLFNGCTSLTQAPELPATDLKFECYKKMFNGCSSLTKAPELPARILSAGCYNQLFEGCKNINEITVNFTSWTEQTTNWVNGISQTGTFNCPASLPKEFGPDKIPEGWTVKTF